MPIVYFNDLQCRPLFCVVESTLQSCPWKTIALKATHTTSLENFSRSPVPRQSIGWTPG